MDFFYLWVPLIINKSPIYNIWALWNILVLWISHTSNFMHRDFFGYLIFIWFLHMAYEFFISIARVGFLLYIIIY